MFEPSEIVLQPAKRLEEVDLKQECEGKKAYEKALQILQNKMQQVQQAYFHQGMRAILVFEGWDAAGKGGAIRRLTEKLDPRGCRVYPIAAPKDEEQGRHYLYRFQTKLPEPGCIAIFDRSYYGRVLVERVEGFATTEEWQRAYQEINEFERMLTDDGVKIIKLFLHIDKNEQRKRFKERLNNPSKRWKLTEEDLRNRAKWKDYHQAINDMLQYTATNHADWHVIAGNHKWHARLAVLETVIAGLEHGVDISPPAIDKSFVKEAEAMLKA
ncbi:polyphosphate kinase 2 family protein [Thalassotalea euphylliae]|uniref:polyphosphate kinase 2 family protein n=1 Tax=Thalassotalea euphylliae TaxID=1655234 RepID=UPI003645C622